MKKFYKIIISIFIFMLMFTCYNNLANAKNVTRNVPKTLRGKWIAKHMIDGQFFIISKNVIDDGRLQSDDYGYKVSSISEKHGVYSIHTYIKMDKVYKNVYKFKKQGKKLLFYINKDMGKSYGKKFEHKKYIVLNRFNKIPSQKISVN